MPPVGKGPGTETSDWPEGEAPARRIVLPRALRKPARMLARLDVKLPRHAGLKGLVLFFGATAAAGVVLGGHATTVVSAATAWGGLGIEVVEISGQSETSEVEILERLALGEYPSVVTFDPIAARERIEELPWVRRATIRKLYPDTLKVEIAERKPYAVWQHDRAMALIDANGKVISDRVDARYAGLPRVVGDGVAEKAATFVALLEEFPSLAPEVKAGVLVSGRRWNIVLNNGVEIMLPEEEPGEALIQAVALDDGHGIFSREIATIDLRLANRLVFRLTETGYKAREALLKERAKKRSRT